IGRALERDNQARAGRMMLLRCLRDRGRGGHLPHTSGRNEDDSKGMKSPGEPDRCGRRRPARVEAIGPSRYYSVRLLQRSPEHPRTRERIASWSTRTSAEIRAMDEPRLNDRFRQGGGLPLPPDFLPLHVDEGGAVLFGKSRITLDLVVEESE